jgi:hypothetical protein
MAVGARSPEERKNEHPITCVCPACHERYETRPIDCDHLLERDEAELAAIFAEAGK